MLWAWIVGYLVMDAVYVLVSKGYYMEQVAAIAGSAPKDVTKVALCALGAYALMALGWAAIVVPRVRRGQTLQAALTGALYGLVLYGVFNCTTGAMFDGWSYAVMARDTAWGTASIAAYTAAYAKLAEA
jgi:uncharacterized membrane protein